MSEKLHPQVTHDQLADFLHKVGPEVAHYETEDGRPREQPQYHIQAVKLARRDVVVNGGLAQERPDQFQQRADDNNRGGYQQDAPVAENVADQAG